MTNDVIPGWWEIVSKVIYFWAGLESWGGMGVCQITFETEGAVASSKAASAAFVVCGVERHDNDVARMRDGRQKYSQDCFSIPSV